MNAIKASGVFRFFSFIKSMLIFKNTNKRLKKINSFLGLNLLDFHCKMSVKRINKFSLWYE